MPSFLTMFASINRSLNTVLWGPPMLLMLASAGAFMALRTKGFAYRHFPFVLKNTFGKVFEKDAAGHGQVSPFQALTTALAAGVGTANIVGVGSAIMMGGPGAIFWMWMAALVGMSTKFSEVTLSVAYRDIDEHGNVRGGPMYYLTKGLKSPLLGKLFAVFGAFATFGIGCTVQSNSIANSVYEVFHVPHLVTGLIVGVIAFVGLIGGIKRIGQVTERLVPFMSIIYITGGIVVIFLHRHNLLPALASIFQHAFHLKAVGGGLTGYTIVMAMRAGVSRGFFSNEAGMGSSPIAHAAATTDHPARQGLWGVFEVFVDTIVICSLTSLVVLTTGIWQTHENPASLVAMSFGEGFFIGPYIVTAGLVLFALSTVLGWSYYGERCAQYLGGDKFSRFYLYVYVVLVVIGAIADLDLVWLVADNLNGLMAIPNLIGVIGLSGVTVRLLRDFLSDPKRIRESAEWQQYLR